MTRCNRGVKYGLEISKPLSWYALSSIGNLSHTSILYCYCNIYDIQIYEDWKQIASSKKASQASEYIKKI